MDKWVKRKWLRALKSGEYGKGKSRLAAPPGHYCCLGVLAEEMVPEFCKVNASSYPYMVVGDGDTSNSYLPDDLAILWGLDRFTQRLLGRINDDNNDFGPVIAYIETNL